MSTETAYEAHINGPLHDARYADEDREPCPACGAAVEMGRIAKTFRCVNPECDWEFDPADLI